jgi:ABC-type multidrug transport system fused ATPase/permease subunit
LRRERGVQVGVYSGTILLMFLLCLVRAINFYRLCMQSSTDLHKRMFAAVITSPIAFFENNPMGKLVSMATTTKNLTFPKNNVQAESSTASRRTWA